MIDSRLQAGLAGCRNGATGFLLNRPRFRLFRNGYERAKRVFDVVTCTIVLPLALVLMAICAALIWLDNPGPVLFRQPRTGRGGRRFVMYKFRSMVINAEEVKLKYAHLNELTWPDFKITNDPRVTWIGRILRKTSLDELPQLFNVLKGEMSMVGPRPTSFDVKTYSLWHTERLEVLPGITGLWQIRGRSKMSFEDRLQLDIQYVRNRGFLLDLEILFRTIPAVFTQRGAC